LFHQIQNDIVARQQIVFLGTLDKVTKADAGCGTSAVNHNIPMTEKYWDPKPVEVWVDECATNLEESFWVWGLGKGYKKYDLTQAEANSHFQEFIMDRLPKGMKKDLMRIVWFNDVNAGHADETNSGIITPGVDLDDYNIIDGLWPQIYDAVGADNSRRTPILKNAQVTYTNQAFNASDTTNKVASGIFRDLIQQADRRLRAKTDKIIICTRSLADQYENELESEQVDASFEMITEGVSVLKRKGVTIYAFDFWDDVIQSDMDNGTHYFQPHRALLTVRQNIPIGFDSREMAATLEQWYERKDKKTNWRGNYKIDTKLLQSYYFQAAY
jgi:hypothetical protein